jgi:V/A-type H+-transporting ATPase subunit D
VNALESIFIPSYLETLAYIEETLEEKDREELFRMKRAKAMHGEEREL